jgi:hypothetical protein
MGKVKEQWLTELEANPVLHERYWFNEMFNSHEPVLPDYHNPLLEFNHEENIRVQQYPSRQNVIRRRTPIIQR